MLQVLPDQIHASLHVLRCIKDNCSDLAKCYDCFQAIEQGLKTDSLRADPITGGLTNYAYKVYLEQSPDVALFAKVSFPYALWNPDRVHYDVQRSQNEYKMMKVFSALAPSCTPFPYLCEPAGDMTVLVTEWCENDEQLAKQVIGGHIDTRVCQALAASIAKLHCQEFDPDFNTGIRTTMRSTFETLRQKLESMHHSTDTSRATRFVKEMELEYWEKLVAVIQNHYEHSRDCLVHSDLHVKNILVESCASEKSEHGKKGSYSVVDWEMAFAGPIGRDIGTLYPFFLGCAMAHALKGDLAATFNLIQAMDLIWKEYSKSLRKGGKGVEFIDYAFRSTIGWCGRFMFLGYFTAGNHMSDFPINSSADKEILLDALGVLGLKFMRWGFDPRYAGDDTAFQGYFQAAIWAEIELVVTLKARREANSIPCLEDIPLECLSRWSMDCLKSILGNQRKLSNLVSLHDLDI